MRKKGGCNHGSITFTENVEEGKRGRVEKGQTFGVPAKTVGVTKQHKIASSLTRARKSNHDAAALLFGTRGKEVIREIKKEGKKGQIKT